MVKRLFAEFRVLAAALFQMEVKHSETGLGWSKADHIGLGTGIDHCVTRLPCTLDKDHLQTTGAALQSQMTNKTNKNLKQNMTLTLRILY